MNFFKDRKNKKKISKERAFDLEQNTLKAGKGYLQGNLIVATTLIKGSCFERSVIFMASHDKTGGMGMIINKELRGAEHEEVIASLGVEMPEKVRNEIKVYLGGPIETTRGFAIHSDDYETKNTVTFPNGIAITSEKEVLEDYIIGKGPKRLMLVMGYAGWVEGQIENEMEEGVWISVPSDIDLLFNTENDAKWKKAADSQGIDIYRLHPFIGSA